MDKEWLRKIPKIDLHCHLDGSMSVEVIKELLADQGELRTDRELELLLQASADCKSLGEYLSKFDLPLKCLQTENGLKRAAADLLKSAAAERITYLEIRFAPLSSVHEGLSCSNVIESVLNGIKDVSESLGIHASVIVCAMRHHSPEQNLEMLHCARSFFKEGVCALDLAGDEHAFPAMAQADLFRKARDLGMPYTIHAGECGSVQNIREAIALGAKRIGHGITLSQDENLMNQCISQRIGIEMCPTSNFQTKAATSWKDYPLSLFLDRNIAVTVNTDNRTVSNTTMTKELIQVSEHFEYGEETIEQLLRNAVEVSFADDAIKHHLLQEMRI